VFNVSRVVMENFCQIPDLWRKVQSAQISDSARRVELSRAINCKPLTVWSHIMDHRKAERVAYCNGI
jgi:hypothetical protein